MRKKQRLFVLPLFVGFLAMPPALVHAQGINVPGIALGGEKSVDPETKEKREQIDRAYRQTTQGVPEQKVNDPWGSVRSAEQPAPKTPAKTQAKTPAKPRPRS